MRFTRLIKAPSLTFVSSPILRRASYLLTPQCDLPELPKGVKGYRQIHIYTVSQVLVTAVIFIVTLTKGAPAFPVIIIALVPIRLLLMNKLWRRETLRHVDAWACRKGTPEDDEDILANVEEPLQGIDYARENSEAAKA